jgi:hypothetical protein
MAGQKASPAGTAGSQDVIDDRPGSDIGAIDRQPAISPWILARLSPAPRLTAAHGAPRTGRR